MKTTRIAFITLLTTLNFSAHADDLSDLRKRVEELETRQSDQIFRNEDQKNVSSFFQDYLTIGGFFNGGIEGMWGDNTRSQITSKNNSLGINVSARPGANFNVAAQFIHVFSNDLTNPHNDPRATTIGLEKSRSHEQSILSVLPQAYLEYSFDRLFNLQAGQGFVPFGYILEIREPVLYVRNQGPQLARETTAFKALWQGLHLHGSSSTKAGEWGYNAYTFTPEPKAEFLAMGARTWLSTDNIITGISAQMGEKKDLETFKVLGADFRFEQDQYQLQTEFAQYFSQIQQDSWTVYIEPGIRLKDEEFLLFVFSDYFFGAINKTTRGAAEISDPIQKWENGAGFNWLPNARTRFRFALTSHEYLGKNSTILGRDRDYYSIDTSVGVSF